MTPADARPITIDIDSLLVGSSLTSECLVEAVRRHPAIVLRLPFWAMRGKAVLRQRLAKYAELDVTTLPYRAAAIEELRRRAEDGTGGVGHDGGTGPGAPRGGASGSRRGADRAGK